MFPEDILDQVLWEYGMLGEMQQVLGAVFMDRIDR